MDSKSAFMDELASMTREDIERIFEEKRLSVRTKKIYPLIILGREDRKDGKQSEKCKSNNR